MFFQTYFQIWLRLRINILCTYTVYLPLQACVLKKSYIHVNPNQSPNSDLFSMSSVRSRFYMTVDVYPSDLKISDGAYPMNRWKFKRGSTIFFQGEMGLKKKYGGKNHIHPVINLITNICHVTVPLFFCFALFHYPCFYFEKFKRGRGLQHQNPFRLDSPMK